MIMKITYHDYEHNFHDYHSNNTFPLLLLLAHALIYLSQLNYMYMKLCNSRARVEVI